MSNTKGTPRTSSDHDPQHLVIPQATLRGVRFHLGSTRSGMLAGAPPSWGTRTGFYTEELRELSCSSPERVRKADLREADLRGARLEGVDLYLVDLRGAQLDELGLQQARLTGAILD